MVDRKERRSYSEEEALLYAGANCAGGPQSSRATSPIALVKRIAPISLFKLCATRPISDASICEATTSLTSTSLTQNVLFIRRHLQPTGSLSGQDNVESTSMLALSFDTPCQRGQDAIQQRQLHLSLFYRDFLTRRVYKSASYTKKTSAAASLRRVDSKSTKAKQKSRVTKGASWPCGRFDCTLGPNIDRDCSTL